nr:integrase, catalytic region, zinc finger, CCHC-type, peptidase aspartic, catalytic [Tanacetum cinerariifolium]
VNPLVSARDKHAIDVEPIIPRLRNNRNAHLNYLRHLKESVETIPDIVEEAKVVRLLDRSIVSACRYTKHSQELLEYAIGICPHGSQPHAKQLAHIPLIRKKQVIVAQPSNKGDSTTACGDSHISEDQCPCASLYRSGLLPHCSRIRKHKFYPRPDSPLHLSNEEHVLGYLKFSAKGTKREIFGMPIPGRLITENIRAAPYYQEYQENVAKHRGLLADETRSTHDLPAPRPAKPARKPQFTAQKAPPKPSILSPVTSTQPAPTSVPAKTQEHKRKQATRTTDKPAKAKRIKHSISRNTRESREEDADFLKAVEESMKDAYALPKGPLPPVVIREPESGKYQPLPKVPGKGKAKVYEEHVSHDLLSLQRHKKTSPVDQYIFQSEEESEKVVLGVEKGSQDEGQAGSNPNETSEGQAGLNPDETSEGQAGPDPDLEDIQYVGSDHDHYQEAACAHHEEYVMHDCVQLDHVVDLHDDYTSDSNIILCDQYVKDNEAQNDLFRAENDKIKQHYKELYDSIKITHAKHIEQVTKLTTENVNLKTCVSKATVNPQVSTRGKHAIDVEPIFPRLRNNRDAHLDYLRHLKESVETIHDIVEEAKVVRPRDRSIVSACRYTKHSQELLEYAISTCPQGSQQRAKQLAHIPLIRKKQVTVAKPSDKSDSTTHRHVVTVKSQKTNIPVPPSTGVTVAPMLVDHNLRAMSRKIGSRQQKVTTSYQ